MSPSAQAAMFLKTTQYGNSGCTGAVTGYTWQIQDTCIPMSATVFSRHTCNTSHFIWTTYSDSGCANQASVSEYEKDTCLGAIGINGKYSCDVSHSYYVTQSQYASSTCAGTWADAKWFIADQCEPSEGGMYMKVGCTSAAAGSGNTATKTLTNACASITDSDRTDINGEKFECTGAPSTGSASGANAITGSV